MKRKNYEKPSMEVYELKQQPQLLAGSVQATRSKAYEEVEDDPWTK